MAHIHTAFGQHDHTASAFIFRLDGTEPKILLIRHKILNLLLQPGGHVELNENIWQAIQHEIVEETGYELSQLKVLQPEYRFPHLANSIIHPTAVVQSTHGFGIEHKHIDTAYAFITYESPSNAPEEGEAQDIYWVTFEEFQALPDNEVVIDVRAIASAIFKHHLEYWKPVPLTEFETLF